MKNKKMIQHLPLPLVNTLRERFQVKHGVTSLCPSGFTLMELLVVVLIIGILAAVSKGGDPGEVSPVESDGTRNSGRPRGLLFKPWRVCRFV